MCGEKSHIQVPTTVYIQEKTYNNNNNVNPLIATNESMSQLNLMNAWWIHLSVVDKDQ